MIMLGVIVASWISYQEAKRRGEDPEHVWQMFPWVLVAGIVGARLGFILVSLGDERYRDFRNIIAIWTGGLSIQGAVIGGALAVIIYCWRSRISFFKWGDVIVPGLALAQAIGRWGNYFNQEAFGTPTTLPWGIPISVQRQREVAGQEFGPDVRFHPTFAYEMILDLANFGLLMWLGRQRRFKLLQGDLIWVYLVVYSVGRFAIEAIRVDSAKVGTIAVPQIFALIGVLIGWGMFIWRHRPNSDAPYSEVNMPDGERRFVTAGARVGEGRRARQTGGASRVRRVSTEMLPQRSDVQATAGEVTSAAGSSSGAMREPSTSPES